MNAKATTTTTDLIKELGRSATSPITDSVKQQMLTEAVSATPNYSVDYSDERFANIESDKNKAMAENQAVYDGMINNTDKYFDAQIQASKDWADKQAQIQQENTDFAIEKIEQQKEQANKDYLKEQSGAYVDWRKQSNQYGSEAEKMASAGLAGTGFSESSQVSMYNTYQNRVATARESYNQAVLNYNNAIKDAQLQNNAALAEIAYNALQQQLELSLQGFQYKNNLILEQANKKTELDNIYYNRWQNVLQQINTENAMAEDVRQFNESMAEDIRQFNENLAFQSEQADLNRQHDKDMAAIEHSYDVKMAQINHEYEIKMLNAKTEKEKELLKIQHENDIKKLNQQLANEKALLKYQYSLKSSSSGGSGGGSSGGGGTVKKGAGGGSSGGTVSGGGSSMKVNTKSKQSLGKGPISDAEAATLINQGKATAVIKNGQVYVSPTKPTLPTSALIKPSAPLIKFNK